MNMKVTGLLLVLGLSAVVAACGPTETTTPDATTPDTTAPDTTAPATTAPDVTAPDATPTTSPSP